jgi:DNA-binding response OmpR family regulator
LAFHLPPLRTYRHRILYAGNDLALLKRLRDTLRDCRIVRAPNGSVARSFIKVINYSLLLFDHVLPDMTGKELAGVTRALPHRERMRIILIPTSEREERIVETITRSLATGESDAR